MALSKSITTPAGNVLGSYGTVDQVHLIAKNGETYVAGAQVSLYASKAAKDASSPPVAVYQYACGMVVLAAGGDATAAAEAAILTTTDVGTWQPSVQGQTQPGRSWTPGWTGGSIVA